MGLKQNWIALCLVSASIWIGSNLAGQVGGQVGGQAGGQLGPNPGNQVAPANMRPGLRPGRPDFGGQLNVIAPVFPQDFQQNTFAPVGGSASVDRSFQVPPTPQLQVEQASAYVRIKDITDIEGVRGFVVEGLGLVTGLAGTGGGGTLTRETLANLLEHDGLRLPPAVRAAIRNDNQFPTTSVSVVWVRAELPPFAYIGQDVDVTVSIVDDATSLQDGVLRQTFLYGLDNQKYIVASGNVSLGGFGAKGQAASVQKNSLTVGRIPNGGVVEQVIPYEEKIGERGYFTLQLRDKDMQTALEIAKTINRQFPQRAEVVGPREIVVRVPPNARPNVVNEFVNYVLEQRVRPSNNAKVVINERNGTIVVGAEVRLSQVAIKHGNITISTVENPQVSQPNPLAGGDTVVLPRTNVNVNEEQGTLNVLNSSSSLIDLVNSLNALGVTPKELSAILQELKRSGHLHAELLID